MKMNWSLENVKQRKHGYTKVIKAVGFLWAQWGKDVLNKQSSTHRHSSEVSFTEAVSDETSCAAVAITELLQWNRRRTTVQCAIGVDHIHSSVESEC